MNPAIIPQKIPALSIFCDGGARGNPGPAASAFFVKDETGKEVYKGGKYLGKATNNIAEYEAVLLALSWLKNNYDIYKSYNLYNLYIDSKLIVSQLNGIFKIKNSNLRELLVKIKILESEIKKPISYNLIPREKNYQADLIVNQTLDKAFYL